MATETVAKKFLFTLTYIVEYLGQVDQFVVPQSEDAEVLEVPDLGAELLKLVVAEVKSPQCCHDKKVARQRILAEVVVGQVQHL